MVAVVCCWGASGNDACLARAAFAVVSPLMLAVMVFLLFLLFVCVYSLVFFVFYSVSL
jgi:hypothetical protein